MEPNEIYNFSAGPGLLPKPVLKQISHDIPDWYKGVSIMELGHRTKPVMDMIEENEARLRALLSIPEDFSVLFMHGGARGQYAAIPLNLNQGIDKANYLVNGYWSKCAYEEAKKFIKPQMVDFESKPNSGAYLHFVDNETIEGIELKEPPKSEGIPVIADMTSNILSKAIDYSALDMIYASAQKNLGIAGVTVAIVRQSLLGNPSKNTPAILDYSLMDSSKSLYNTPPVFALYVSNLVLKWVQAEGGVEVMAKRAAERSSALYSCIDQSDFYHNKIAQNLRSRINIPFQFQDEGMLERFCKEAEQAGLLFLKGHRAVGGARASMYNAMPLKGIESLVAFMKQFEKRYG